MLLVRHNCRNLLLTFAEQQSSRLGSRLVTNSARYQRPEEDNEQFKKELREVMQCVKEDERRHSQESAEKMRLFRKTSTEETEYHVPGPRDTHFSLGLSVSLTEDLDTVITTLEEAVKIQTATMPEASIHTAKSLEEIAVLYHRKLDFNKAISFYRQAVSIYEDLARARAKETGKVFNIRTPDGKLINNNPSINYEKDIAGETKTVVDEIGQQHSISVDNKEKGKERIGSFDIARCFSYLGVCYRDAGKLEKSEELLTCALHMKLATVGPHHISTAETLNNLGAIYHYEEQYEEACNCFEDAIRNMIGTLGGASTSDPYLAMLYYNLGLSLRARNELPGAVVALAKAHRVAGGGLGTSHETTKRIEKELKEVEEILLRFNAKTKHD